MPRRMSTEDFIQRAQQVHVSKYDYSRVQYVNNRTKVEIICPEHGSFWQIPFNHLKGSGCPECRREKLSDRFSNTKDAFIQKAREIHGDRYDYSRVKYKNSRTKVEIVCSQHGSFYQTPSNHISKGNRNGCPVCSGSKRRTREEFIEKARLVHGDKYDYSKVQYENGIKKVEIVCSEHGSFWQTPNNHLVGNGCFECGKRTIKEKLSSTTRTFIQRAKQVHGDKYDYSFVEYKNNRTNVKIICPFHGPFFQKPHEHLSGHGCSRCASNISKGEQELAEALSAMGLRVIQSYRKWCPGRPKLEIDIYLPEHQIGVEYNGEYWHQDREKDKEKISLALKQGIQIITVWESEWKKNKEAVLEMLEEVLIKV